MAILDDTDLQVLADLFQDLAMKDDCTISRVASVPDPYGTQVAGEPIIVIETKCLITPLPRPVVLQAYNDKIGVFAKWHVALPLNTNPLIGDIITTSGQKMIVQIVITPQTFAVNDEVLAAEIE